MIATIAVIVEEKKFSDRSDHMETTFQRSQRKRSLRSLESGFLMITMIAELFFLSDHMETRLKLRIFST